MLYRFKDGSEETMYLIKDGEEHDKHIEYIIRRLHQIIGLAASIQICIWKTLTNEELLEEYKKQRGKIDDLRRYILYLNEDIEIKAISI